MPYNMSRFQEFPTAFMAAVSLVIFGLLACFFSVANSTVLTGSFESCTVAKKDKVASTKGGHDLFIHAQGCNGNSEIRVFSMLKDSNSGALEEAISFEDVEIGNSYDFTTLGFHVPLNSPEHIIKITSK